jgi:transposase
MVKVWDLDTQRCVQTLVGHHNPVWALAVSPDNGTLVTGSTDKTLRVWKLGAAAREFELKVQEKESGRERRRRRREERGKMRRGEKGEEGEGGVNI